MRCHTNKNAMISDGCQVLRYKTYTPGDTFVYIGCNDFAGLWKLQWVRCVVSTVLSADGDRCASARERGPLVSGANEGGRSRRPARRREVRGSVCGSGSLDPLPVTRVPWLGHSPRPNACLRRWIGSTAIGKTEDLGDYCTKEFWGEVQANLGLVE